MTEQRVQTFRGKEFRVVRGSTHPEYSFHTFELEENSFREQHWNVSEGDVVVDGGASYGSYALTACASGATVYAFEPERTVFTDLVRNVELNGWQDRCRPFNCGLWDRTDVVSMSSYAPHWATSAISGDYQMRALDDVVTELGLDRIDWVKLDVEGAEEKAVRGALGSVRRFRPRILVECHVFLDVGLVDKVRSLLLSVSGYSFQEVDRDPCVMLIATPSGL